MVTVHDRKYEPRDTELVRSVIERDSTGIEYRVEVETLDPHAVEQGDATEIIWETRVNFGGSDSHQAGGAAFVLTAREQDHIAARVAADRHSTVEELIRLFNPEGLCLPIAIGGESLDSAEKF